MESPVRICLGAALVVNLLLLSSTSGSAISQPPTSQDAKPSARFARLENTTAPGTLTSSRTKTPDDTLNDLKPKEQESKDRTNLKYKRRGNIRFSATSSSTTTTTETPKRKRVTQPNNNVMIVTPTPPKKNVTQIIEGMKNYKRTKMPLLSSTSSTTPVAVTKDEEESEEDDDDDDDFEKFTSSKYHDNFFTTSGFFSDEDTREDQDRENTNEKDLSVSPLETYSSYFPQRPSFSTHDPPKSSYFHDFESDLTTPKNDYFDKKFREISSSIMKSLAASRATAPTTANSEAAKVVSEKINLSNVNKGIPRNKSTVFYKNTKEVRLLDNEGAGSAKQELSDVEGTSIYYEMSVLSTETYVVDDSNDDDCDDTESPTEETKPGVKSAKPTLPTLPATRPTFTENFKVAPTAPTFPTAGSFSTSKSTSMNSVLSTEKTKTVSTSFSSRNTYSKRMNVTGSKAPNSINSREQGASGQFMTQSRKFASTTPKNKPVWMAPRRNPTRNYSRTPTPSTIYYEHFDVKDKMTTTERPNRSNRTYLTTVASEIDPVLQSDHSGTKKVVSQSVSDNSIPSLWKRGSVKYSSSTAPSPTQNSQTSDLEMPLTAWALASLRIPPSFASPINGSQPPQKPVDENELQKVGDIADTKATSPLTTALPTTQGLNDFTHKIISDINQNKLPWKPSFAAPTTETVERHTERNVPTESLPAESNINEQSRVQPTSTQSNEPIETTKQQDKSSTVGATTEPTKEVTVDQTTQKSILDSENDALPPVSSTKSTRFESITKLPSGVTTPQGESAPSTHPKTEIRTEINTLPPTTTDYEITTIRFNYVPVVTEESSEITEEDGTTITTWHPIIPSRTNPSTIDDAPVTTYRPKYMTTTELQEESTTNIPETTETAEVTETTTKTSDETMMSVEPLPTKTESDDIEVTTSRAYVTTMTVVDVVTEINTEKQRPIETTIKPTEPSTEPATSTTKEEKSEESASEENSGSNEVITIETTKMTTKSSTTESTTRTEITEPAKTETSSESVETPAEEELPKEATTLENSHIETAKDDIDETTTDYYTTKPINEIDDLSNSINDVTTEASVGISPPEEAGSGAAVAIAVSTIGVIALILLIGLLLIVRRRGRRGVYAQRCTPVSLDAYSLDSVSVGRRKGNQRLRASKRSYGNPAFDDEVTSHPMNYAALANFALDVDSISAEFSEIPSVTVRSDEVPPGCEDKNRYSNVLPLPETRVPLSRIGNDPTTEYINANFVTGPGNIKNYYIACQAPLQNTVADVWRMIWEHNSRLIVMLTEYMENGVEKCYEYLPPSEVSDNKRTFGDFQVILKKREQRDKYAVSTIQLINTKTRTWREITHLWYFWPARGVPDDYDSILDFLSEMRGCMKMAQTAKEYDEDGVEVIYGDQNRSSYHNLSKVRSSEGSPPGNGVRVYSPTRAEEMMKRSTVTNGTLGRMKAASEIEGVRPCVVMCASGAGRAACALALDVCARALAAGQVDVPRVVRELRAQRPHSLSNRQHYVFLYKVLSEYGNKLMGGGIDTI